MPSDYRLSPRLAARLLGVVLVLWACLVFLATGLVVLLSAPAWLLSSTVVVGLVAVLVTGSALTRQAYVVRLADDGYRIRFVRGAGVPQARWTDVHDVVEEEIAGSRCLVLRLRSGAHSVIPLEVLAGDSEAFIRDLREHLDRGHGLRRLA